MSASTSPRDYYEGFEFEAALRGRSLCIASKAGLNESRELSPATLLLSESVEVSTDHRVVMLGADRGALAAALSPEVSKGRLLIADINLISLDLAVKTLDLSGTANVCVLKEADLPANESGTFDLVAMLLPKGRDLARRWLLQAHAALKAGGILYLAGANNEGIQPVIKDAQSLFGNGETVANRQRNRVARLVKSAESLPLPDWAAEPGIAPGSWRVFEVNTDGTPFLLHSLPGIFSYDRLDDCTAMLLLHCHVTPDTRVLDVGCGNGIIGLTAARRGAAKVDMIDVSLLAIAAARKNIETLGLTNAEALLSDSLSAVMDRHYDLVLTNPPFHTGKAINYDVAHSFIESSARLLAPGGKLLLAANQFIRYEAIVQKSFRSHRILEDNGKFYVLEAVKGPSG